MHLWAKKSVIMFPESKLQIWSSRGGLEVEQWSYNRTLSISVDYMVPLDQPLCDVRPGCVLYVCVSNLYHVISNLRVVSNAQRQLLRTASCDVNKRIKGTWCHYIKKDSNYKLSFNLYELYNYNELKCMTLNLNQRFSSCQTNLIILRRHNSIWVDYL